MATPTEAPLWAMCEGREAMLVLLQGRSVTVGVAFYCHCGVTGALKEKVV